MIEVEWTPAAQADLARIDEDLAAVDPDFADRIGAHAIRSARFLAQWPEAAPQVGRRKHKWPVKGTPYILLYRFTKGRIEILRVRHERENWRRT